MIASRGLVLVAASALVLMALNGPADAVGTPTCRGLPATIVGAPGGQVTGTDGDDVIVTNGATTTHAKLGDDTVCATGGDQYVYGEGGDDVVDTTAAQAGVRVELGDGADTFVGGEGPDDVFTGATYADRTPVDDDVDRVSTGGGSDRVESGQPGRPNHDDVDLGPGPDVLKLAAVRNDGVLTGGPDANSVELELNHGGHWVVDDQADQISLDGTIVGHWTQLAVSEIDGKPDRTVSYIGSAESDNLWIAVQVEDLDLGAGDDQVSVNLRGPVSGDVTGGPGHDFLIAYGRTSVDVDLGAHRLSTAPEVSGYDVSAFEHIDADARQVRMTGSAGPDDLGYAACTAVIHGAGGDDDLHPFSGGDCETRGINRVFGGPGDDYLFGSPWRDHLDGGPGNDEVYGRGGVDWCRGETHGGCELP